MMGEERRDGCHREPPGPGAPPHDRDDVANRPTMAAEALEALVADRARFLAFLERRTGDRDLARDLLQDALVRSIEKGGQLRQGETVVSWFFRLLRNALTDRHRRHRVAAKALERFANELATDAESAVAELSAPGRSPCRCVTGLLAELKPAYKDALLAVDVDGGRVKDYATKAGIERNNAAVRIHRARAALESKVRAYCGACAADGCLDCDCAHGPDAEAPGGCAGRDGAR